MTLALPIRLVDCHLIDANDKMIALLRGSLPEYRERGAEIVSAVNTRADLLSAARAIYQAVHGDDVAIGPLWGRLHAAIAAAEERMS